jgi:hypothetical protein
MLPFLGNPHYVMKAVNALEVAKGVRFMHQSTAQARLCRRVSRAFCIVLPEVDNI